MSRGIVLVALFFAVGHAPRASLAQVYECDGVWKNSPCVVEQNGVKVQELNSSGIEEEDPEKGIRRRAKFKFDDLDIKRFDAKQRYGINFDIGPARSECLGESVDLKGCEEQVGALSNQLQILVDQARVARAEEERARGERQSQPTTVIIVNQGFYDTPIPVIDGGESAKPERPIAPERPIIPPSSGNPKPQPPEVTEPKVGVGRVPAAGNQRMLLGGSSRAFTKNNDTK